MNRLLVPGLAALAFALALIQRPGEATSDTKIGLHVDPVGFLGDVAAAWSPTEDLGHVQGGQYGGYLFPMGPFFALGRLVGVAPWLVHRLWLGVVLALAAWGMVRLMDALAGRPRGAAHLLAGLLFLLNPYVAVFTARTSVTLLGYAALPWLLLCVHRGLRAPRSWWWPAAFALAVACTGGGVNAAVTAWVLLGPLLLALYELATRAVERRAVVAFGWRTVLLTGLGAVWWVIPTLVQARHGVDFLRFTEQPGTIWSTTSLPESLRLMGYWISYLGVGYGGRLRPLFGDGAVFLFAWPVVIAGLLVPAIVLSSFALVRRSRAAAFLLALALAGLVVMVAGFPEGTPLRRAMNFSYNHVAPLQFLRTTYKAGPLLALALAGLGGLAAVRAAPWLRARGRALPVLALAGLAGLAAVASWPLVRGQALDSQLTWDRIPPAWESAADHVDDTVGENGRAVVLPGQLYADYDWGGTVDAILPALADRPVAVRYAVPYADLRAVDLLWTLDGLVQQRRALPGQLGPLADLLSARTVVAGADDDRAGSGAVTAADAADMLDQLGEPDAAWGPVRREPRAAGTLGAPRPLPRVRAWDRPGARAMVRLEADAGATVLDGSADGLAGLAAFGALPAGRISYAGDASAGEMRRAGEVVISDSNRRRVLAAARMSQNHGATLAADDPFSPDAAVLDLFPARGTDSQTVATYEGARSLRMPFSPAYSQFPERRPFAAFDGDPATHWQADRALEEARHWLEIGFERPRDVDAIELLPYSDRRAKVTAVEVAGRTLDVRQGWNRLELGLRGVRSLRVRIARVVAPEGVPEGPGGIRELRIPGVKVREALRPPVLAEKALAGRNLSRTGLTYLFERTAGDDPFRRDPRRGSAGAVLVRDRQDGERGLERVIAPPAARDWAADGWGTVDARARDSAIDALAGAGGAAGGSGGGAATFESSGRFEGRPGFRASSAFDSSPRPWIGSWLDGRTAWLEWTVPDPATFRELRLEPADEAVRRPTLVRVHVDGEATPELPVAADGRVVLPEALRGRTVRIEILRAAFPDEATGVERQRRAVGIREITGAGVPIVRQRRDGSVEGHCGDLEGTLGTARVRMRVDATLADLDAGRPLRLRPCGAPTHAPAGPARFEIPAGTLAPYLVRLRSPAPDPAARAAAIPGQVLDPGTAKRDARTGVRLEVHEPAWLVLAQAYSDAWRASCDGRDLGAPVPVDGFAMGWRVPAGCKVAGMVFAPDGLVRAGYLVSLPFLLAMLGLVLVRRPPEPELAAPPDELPEPSSARLPAGRAAALALLTGAVLGFVFATRGAPLIALGTFVILWRGIGVRALVAAAAVLLLVAVPVLTLAIGVEDRGGYNPEYAQVRIAVHWVAVAALILLALALARVLGAARRRRSPA
jgi:arabinofuranan 3-O-arabinosyltransferase